MIVDCISDTHGYYPKLESGDLLIVAGDLTARDTEEQHLKVSDWIFQQDYKKIVFIAGNHDNFLKKNPDSFKKSDSNLISRILYPETSTVEYLCDSGTEFEGLKIWGSPWSLTFDGINPFCTAFTGTEKDLKAKYYLIPNDIDILITHQPPFMVLDEIKDYHSGQVKSVGSLMLRHRLDIIKPALHVFGHIHENGGKELLYKHQGKNTICVNASIVDEKYKHVNKPVRLIL